ncbi:hypothetical protein HK101_002218 [Irineochytrium annulatum]|nr:hypothetical protein HK101_002218 [Irineochytrium annulatum]
MSAPANSPSSAATQPNDVLQHYDPEFHAQSQSATGLTAGPSSPGVDGKNGGGSDRVSIESQKGLMNGSHDGEGSVHPPPQKKILGVVVTRRRKICFFVCLGVGLLLTAIFIPIVIFVIAPKIAQSSIDGSNLNFEQVGIAAPQNSSFLMSSTGTITNAGFLDATISFPSPINIYWTNRENGDPDMLLGNVNLPPISVSGAPPKSGALSISGTTVTITDETGMGVFSSYLIKGQQFSWRLQGSAQAKALGLTFNGLSLNKVVTLGGFQGLSNVTITSFNLPDSDPMAGIRLETTTALQNPSHISIELGDLNFDSYFGATKIGSLSGTNVTLHPGENDLSLNGRLIPMKDTTSLSQVFTFFVGGKGSVLDVVGTSVLGPLGYVSWLNAGFDGLKLSVTLSPPQNQQQLVSNIQIPALSVNFNPQDPSGYHLTTTAPAINAYFTSPFNFPLTIFTASQNLNFTDASGNAFLNVNVPFVPAKGDQYNHTLATSFTNAPLDVIPGQEAAFQEFFKALTVGDEYKVHIQGLVSTQAGTAAGNVTISNVSLTDSLVLHGFKGLNQVAIGAVNVASGDANGIHLTIATTITNPSSLSLAVNADVVMQLQAQGQVLGNVVLPKLALVPGPNVITATSLFNPQGDAAIAAGRQLLSGFLAGTSSPVTILGTPNSTPYKSLEASFSGLTINTNLPGQTKPLIGGSWLNFNNLAVTTAPVYLLLNNPLATDFTLLHLTTSISYNGQIIGNIDQDLAGNPIKVPAGGSLNAGPITASLNINIISLQALVAGLSGNLKIDAKATLLTAVGSYQTTVDYVQTGVSTSLGVPK